MSRAPWVVAVSIALAAPFAAMAQGTSGPAYRVKEEVIVKGRVTSVTTIPDWMGKDGVNLVVESPDAALTHVDVATAGFLDLLGFPIAVGDEVKLKGCWGETSKGQVFLVHELTKNKVTLNVRDDRGMPLW